MDDRWDSAKQTCMAASRSRPRAEGSAASPEETYARAIQLADEMGTAWRRGERSPAEKWLIQLSGLAGSPDAALVLIGEEVRLRRVYGPPLLREELIRRFPQWVAECTSLLAEPQGAPTCRAPLFPSIGEMIADCRLILELGRGA